MPTSHDTTPTHRTRAELALERAEAARREADAEAMLVEKGTAVKHSFDDWHLCEAVLGDGPAVD